MARKTPVTSLKQFSEINLTPLMDLTFILLITFIITFPLIEQGIPVQLPQGSSRPLDPERARTVSLDEEGNVYFDDVPIAVQELARQLRQLHEADPGVTIMVRADERLAYGRVVEVLKLVHDAQITRLALVTREGNGAAP